MLSLIPTSTEPSYLLQPETLPPEQIERESHMPLEYCADINGSSIGTMFLRYNGEDSSVTSRQKLIDLIIAQPNQIFTDLATGPTFTDKKTGLEVPEWHDKMQAAILRDAIKGPLKIGSAYEFVLPDPNFLNQNLEQAALYLKIIKGWGRSPELIHIPITALALPGGNPFDIDKGQEFSLEEKTQLMKAYQEIKAALELISKQTLTSQEIRQKINMFISSSESSTTWLTTTQVAAEVMGTSI